jgi:hypothetical protein
MKKQQSSEVAEIKKGDRVKSIRTGRLGTAGEFRHVGYVYVVFDDGGRELCQGNWLEKA